MSENLAPVPGAALAASYALDLGPGRNLVIQTHFGLEDSEKLLAQQFDKVCRAGDRVRARYEIEELQVKIRSRLREMAFTEDQMARAEENYQQACKRREHLVAHEGEQDVAAFTKGARRGDYRPSDKFEARVKALVEEQQRETQERDRTLENHRATKARLQQDIDDWQAEIAAKEELIRAPYLGSDS